MNRHERRGAAKRGAGATVDPGFEGFRANLKKSFPDLPDRKVGEAWMRNDIIDMPYGPPETWRHVPGSITVQLLYKAGSISAAVAPDDIKPMIEHWGGLVDKLEDPRAVTRGTIVEGLATNRQNDQGGANTLIHAALWLAWTSAAGPDFHDRLTRGDVRLVYEITDIRPKAFNFRLGLFDLLDIPG